MSTETPGQDRRLGPSRLSLWSGSRVAKLWLIWPAILLTILVAGAVASLIVQRGFVELRLALTRSNLIMLALALVLPPTGLTFVWWRTHGRRRTDR